MALNFYPHALQNNIWMPSEMRLLQMVNGKSGSFACPHQQQQNENKGVNDTSRASDTLCSAIIYLATNQKRLQKCQEVTPQRNR